MQDQAQPDWKTHRGEAEAVLDEMVDILEAIEELPGLWLPHL